MANKPPDTEWAITLAVRVNKPSVYCTRAADGAVGRYRSLTCCRSKAVNASTAATMNQLCWPRFLKSTLSPAQSTCLTLADTDDAKCFAQLNISQQLVARKMNKNIYIKLVMLRNFQEFAYHWEIPLQAPHKLIFNPLTQITGQQRVLDRCQKPRSLIFSTLARTKN